MSLSQVLSILQARRKTALWIFSIIVGATLVLSLLMPRQYLASTQVVVDLKPDPVNGGLPPGLLLRPYLKTQAQIIESERLRLMVVDRLGLARRGDFMRRYATLSDTPQQLRQRIAEGLGNNLRVTPGQESTFLTISYRAPNAALAAELANAFAQAFIDTNIEMRTLPAAQRRDWYISQSQVMRGRLDASQKRLTDFQRERSILTSNESRDVGQQRLEALSVALLRASGKANDLTIQSRQARAALKAGNAESVPQILENRTIQQLKAAHAALRSRYNEQLTVLGRKHPQMRRIGNEMWSVKKRIDDESETVIAGLEKARDNAIARRDRLAKAMATQKGTLLTSGNDREALSLLQRDVQNAQRAYDEVLTQLNRNSLQSATNFANVFVMSPAMAPSRASSPNVLLNTALAVFLGTLLAIGMSLLLELRRRRVHSSDDLEQATGGPLIGTISAVSRSAMGPSGPAAQA